VTVCTWCRTSPAVSAAIAISSACWNWDTEAVGDGLHHEAAHNAALGQGVEREQQDVGGGTGGGHGVLTSSMLRLIHTRHLPLEPLNALMRERRLGRVANRDHSGCVVAWVDPVVLAELREACRFSASPERKNSPPRPRPRRA
jgi:hypothetical protein